MKKSILNESGSFTLEAVIIFPAFLFLMMALINFINLVSVYIAVDHAVNETVKQIAVRSYPLKHLTTSAAAGNTQTKFAEIINNLELLRPSSGKVIKTAATNDLVNLIGNKINEKISPEVLNLIARSLIVNKIKALYPLDNLEDRNFKIVSLNIYNPNSPETGNTGGLSINNKDIVISVEYKVKLAVPFFKIKDVTLSNTAVEKAWVD